MIPVVYWLVIFSIVIHGLSIPALDAFYRYKKIPPISEAEPAEIRVLSDHQVLPNNARHNPKRNSVILHNRFSRPVSTGSGPELYRWHKRDSEATVDSYRQEEAHGDRPQTIQFADRL